MTRETEQPPLNRAIEDILAIAQDEHERAALLDTWIRLGCEYLAQTAGRRRLVATLGGLEHWAQSAQPTRPWKP